MLTKPSLVFTVAFILISVLTILGDVLGILWLHYAAKPLIMLLLLGYVWQQDWAGGYSTQIRWLVVGMVFALAGDVFLMIRTIDLFMPGLGAFLVMQLCYSWSFYGSIRQSARGISMRSVWPVLILFVLYDAVFLYLLHLAFGQDLALSGLWWPVVIYAICLSMMGLLATQRPKLPGYGWVVAGALLFILSDSLIAVNKFRFPIPGSAFFVMSTYAAAQYLIVVGMVKQIVSCPAR